MNPVDFDRRPLLFALLAVLLVGLLAWSPGVERSAHASRLNQTIPTPTPQGQPAKPTNPARTPRATAQQPEPTDTESPAPAATGTAVPSLPAPTGGLAPTPTPGLATEPATAAAATAEVVTSPPTLPSEVYSPAPEAAAEPSAPAPALEVTETPVLLEQVTTESAPLASPAGASVTPAAVTALTATAETEQDVAADSPTGGSASLSYLWIAGGLVLVGAGVAVLLVRRRAG